MVFRSSLYYYCNFSLRLKIFQFFKKCFKRESTVHAVPCGTHHHCDLPTHVNSFQNCFLLYDKFFPPRLVFPLRRSLDVGLQKNDYHLVVHVLLNPGLVLSPLPSRFPHPALDKNTQLILLSAPTSTLK